MSKNQAGSDAGLRELFFAKLAESQISDALAKKLHFKLRGRNDPLPGPIPSPAGGFTIPYFDLAGKQTKFWRYRYLENPDAGTFAAISDHKQLRYVQAHGSLNELYLPPLVNWQKISQDPSVAVAFTEGELKSACGTAYTEYPTIGLGGVWMFRSARKGEPLLPMFEKFVWEGRDVYISYDSDTATNPKVVQAQNKLAHDLSRLGAHPWIVKIPQINGSKVGLDDYIVQNGAAAVHDELYPRATLYKDFEELHKLNGEVIYVRDPGHIVKTDTGQRISPRAFFEHAYSTRVYHAREEDKKGGVKLVEKSAPKEWLKWPMRSEVERAVYEPGGPRITHGNLNVWPGWGCEPVKGDVSPWRKLLDHLFQGDKDARTWFERWCAYPIQHPGTKLYSSALLWGLVHGTGKSFVGYSLFKIYGRNGIEIKEKQLYADFNEWAENRQFVMGDEISSGDKRETGDKMKSVITQQKITINRKYTPEYELVDCINYYFTSNHPDAFFLEDKDRRYFIWEVRAEPLPDEFYRAYEKWIGSPGELGPGAGALFQHLLTLDLGNFDPRAKAPMTDSKADMLQLGRSDLGAWVAALRESPDTVLRLGDHQIKFSVFRADDLLALYDPERRGRTTANGMARELRKQGFVQAYRGQPVPTKTDGSVRLWVIRPVDPRIASSAAVGKIYDQEREAKYK
jgi:hypothetical protein